ncbi:MAG: aa3-type cytochrome c oxidase subunit IV [Roseitalea sp.]|uniref:Aa3-type cytochrome c oxidase subunit IV n=1 Tax=Oceaniradius stylonematis TaxID=2184161 RepID=A0A3A8APF5_9HYPH|nr:aa3-type cytochrome c oxidase subunit IV [Oceaniradius stylonematis]MBO6551903.1 aa3-type cytochrome c oxidase subunit IV [Roseitalea sp.]MBO6951717.1 aa3-type cytochrome c oxidase subunit IV [Rhizobiaceae bacterium]MBO6592437.1 aa3-type cytochrome c oxidase subunit IV [Roseitalea sp.]MBO6598692.1 aa3-type cytochrome c oxidase subunit IV [Roseitalea sp.]MBO6611138.1 aa3-type cytochrome c oxidase subunit IV [Roseitalea sp.]
MGEQTETNHDAGAAMDYPEHEKTFNLFLALTKWGTVATAALLIAMAFGFFAGGGLLGGIIVFVLLMIVSRFVL